MTARKRLEALEARAPATEQITIIRAIIRPDGSVAGYLDGQGRTLSPDHPLLEGRPPATPEVNGGFRETALESVGLDSGRLDPAKV